MPDDTQRDLKSIPSTVTATKTDNSRTLFDIQAAKLDALKQALMEKMNREMFEDGASVVRIRTEPTWRPSWTWRLARVRMYGVTLWKALRGVELEEPYDD
jgi:hypothetical protein